MGVIVLLAGVLLLIAGGASFASTPVAARRPLRRPTQAASIALVVAGAALVALGGAQLLG